MVNLKRNALVLASLMAVSNVAVAAEDKAASVIEPIIVRDHPVADMHSADFEVGVFGGVVNLDGTSNGVTSGTTDVSFGARFGYYFTDNIFAEVNYSVTNHPNEVTYYDGVLGYVFHQDTYLWSGFAAKTSLFFVAGGGKTDYDQGGDINTIVGGAGYRVMLNEQFSVRFDLRGHVHHEYGNDDEWAIDPEATMGVSYFF